MSEKLEQSAKVMANMKNKNKNKKTQLRTTRKPNKELFVVVATTAVGGMGGEMMTEEE
jgi:mannitol-specific phosphotransferase system IIBC component